MTVTIKKRKLKESRQHFAKLMQTKYKILLNFLNKPEFIQI